jgi:dipeptidyl aminopeptidase/acylaminoacyl peptidase
MNSAKSAKPSRKIPLRDFFRNPEKNNYLISPSGKKISFLAPHEGRMNIFISETGSDRSERITDVKDRDIMAYYWGNDNTLLYMKDNAGDENYHLYSINTEGKNLKELTPFENVKCGIVDELYDSDSEVLIELNRRNLEIFDVYRLNFETGVMNMVAENPGNVSGWLTDHSGRVRAAKTTDGVNSGLLYRENESEPFKTVLTTNFREQLMPLFFTFDNRNLYAASNLGRDKTAIVIFDPAEAKELEVIYEHPEVDVSFMKYSRKRKVLSVIRYTTWKSQREFLDDVIRVIFGKLEKLLPGYEIGIADVDRSEEKLIIRTYSDRSLGAYYLYDSVKDKLELIANVSPWINEDEMAEVKPYSYVTSDGLPLQGYLTLPKGKEPKNLPLVVNPHGGPWHRDAWGFNPEVQFLANRGYAVLQVNFRGSTGYGRKFWESSFKQWGLAMQRDLTEGVNNLIEAGIADPKRVAIYGGSYGGYAVLAGLAFTPDVYAAGVDFVGVSNLFTFMNSIPPYWKQYLETLYEMVGDPVKDEELLRAASPVFHVDKIKAPLLIAQGRKDPRVNVNESDQMVEALKKRGIDVPYMVKDNEGHGFHNEENKIEFYEMMEKFLQKHLLD